MPEWLITIMTTAAFCTFPVWLLVMWDKATSLPEPSAEFEESIEIVGQSVHAGEAWPIEIEGVHPPRG